MKIYFAGSIRGGRDDKELYARIVGFLKQYGTVLSEHIGNVDLSAHGETKLSDVDIYERDMMWLRESDVVVAEVTTPSLGVGYEIGMAEAMHKPMLCLFRSAPDKRLSAMFAGNKHLEVFAYSREEEAELAIEAFFRKI